MSTALHTAVATETPDRELMRRADARSVSIVIPAYDDAENIGVVIEAALDLLPRLTDDYEIVIVDDVSTDDTRAVIERYAAHHPRVHAFRNDRNIGCHATELRGFGLARGDLLFFIPSDRQIMPDQLPVCLAAMAGADYVCTKRVIRADPPYRRVISACYNAGVRAIFRLPIHDVNSSVLVRRSVIEKIGGKVNATSTFIAVELVIRAQYAGFRIAEAPIEHHPRVAGKARGLRPKDMIRIPINLVAMWVPLLRLRATLRRENKEMRA